MDAGQLREPVTFQSKTTVSDGGGGTTPTWSNTFTDRVRIKPIVVEESVKQEQNQQQNKYEIHMRYRSTVNRNMRIIWGSITLTIISHPINYDEKKQWLKLIAKQE